MKNQTLFEESIPVLILYLTNLSTILSKGQSQVKKRSPAISEKKLIETKLAPDMYNLIQQVGYAYFAALEVAETFTGKKPPELSYDEKSISELKSSLRKVIQYLESIKSRDFVYSPKKKVKTYLSQKSVFAPEKYVRELALPNFFFHVTTAYDILRHKGVTLKKTDYLGLK